MLGNIIVLAPIFNSHLAPKYGYPFPVFSRAHMNFGSIARIDAGCCCLRWFGIQAWIAASLHVFFKSVFRWENPGWTIDGHLPGEWIGFALSGD